MELTIKNLSKKFGDSTNQVLAVNNVSFHIKERTFAAIIGDSGSGKSTLLNLIGGLETATSGEIWLDNTNITSLAGDSFIHYQRENIGFVFQEFNLVDFLTVKENIVLPVSLINRNINNILFEQIVTHLGIEKLLNKYPATLSGGEKQRVAIARALFIEPKLILADEPTGSLDSRNSEEVFKLLKQLSEKFEQTIIMVTHNLSLAQKCDKVMRMKDGKIYGE